MADDLSTLSEEEIEAQIAELESEISNSSDQDRDIEAEIAAVQASIAEDESIDNTSPNTQEDRILPLPTPTPNMYDGMTYAEAKDLYNQYLEDPNTRLRKDFNVGDENQNIIEKSIGFMEASLPFSFDSYTNPETGEVGNIIDPRAQFFGSEVPIVGKLAQTTMDAINPNILADRPADTSIVDKLEAGTRNVATNMLELGASVVDFATHKGADAIANTLDDFGVYDNLSEEEREERLTNIRDSGTDLLSVTDKMSKTRIGDAGLLSQDFLFVDVVPTVGTFIGGSLVSIAKVAPQIPQKYAQAAPFISKQLNRVIKGITGAGGGEVALAAGSSSDTGTVFLGENSLVGGLLNEDNAFAQLLDGVRGGDTEAGQILAARTNIMLDAYLTFGAASGIMEAVKVPGQFVANAVIIPIYKSVAPSMDRAMLAVAEEINNAVNGINISSTVDEIAAAKDKLISILQRNKDVVIRMGDEPVIDFTVDSMTAISRSDAASPEMKLRASNEAKTSLNKGNTEFSVASNAPETQLNQFVDDTGKALGGSEEIAVAGTALTDDALSTVKVANDNLETTQQALKDADELVAQRQTLQALAEDEAVAAVTNNAELAARISAMTDGGVTKTTAPLDQSREAIISNLEESKRFMDQKKNDLFNAIPDGLDFDAESFAKTVAEAVKASNAFDPTGKALLSTRLISTIQTALRSSKATVKEGQEVADDVTKLLIKAGVDADSIDLDVPTLISVLKGKGVDFKVLYNQVRPALSKLASESFDNGQREVGSAIRSIVHGIDGQVEKLAELNGKAVPEVKKAMEYYKREYAPTWRDGKLREFGDLQSNTIGRTSKADLEAGYPKVGQVDFNIGSEKIVDEIFSSASGSAAAAKQVIKLLKEKELTFANPDNAYNYIMSDIVLSFYNKVAKSSEGGPLPIDIAVKAREVGRILRENFPERSDEFNAFFANMEELALTAQGKKALTDGANVVRNNAQKNVDEAIERATKVKNDIDASELRFFVQKLGGTYNPKEPYKAFTDLFNNLNGGVQATQQLMDRAAGNPAVLSGIKAAWHKNFRQKMLNPRTDSLGNKRPKYSSFYKSSEEADNLFATGDIVFADNPEILQISRAMLELADINDTMKTGSIIKGQSQTASYLQNIQRQGERGVSSMIKATLGPLNSLGTKIGTVTGNLLNAINPNSYYAMAYDTLMSNPDLLIKYLKISQEKTASPTQIKEITDYITSGIVRSIVYNEDNPDVEDYVREVGDINILANEVSNTVSTAVSKQVEDILK